MENYNYIEFIENNLIDERNRNIELYDWEKNIIKKTLGDNKIKKIWILTKRKSGATSFCHWLHWLRTEEEETYLISHNNRRAEYIKRSSVIRLKNIFYKNNYIQQFGISWLNIISPRSIKLGLLDERENLKQVLHEQLLGLSDDNAKNVEKQTYHFWYDSNKFDKEVYTKLNTYNYTFFTINLPYEEYENAKEFIEADRNREDTIILVEPFGVDRNTEIEKIGEEFNKYRNEHLK